MRPLAVMAAFLGACGGGRAAAPGATPDSPGVTAQLAEEDAFKPSYGKAELDRALIAERGAEATAERRVAELEAAGVEAAGVDDRLRVARGDLEVRRRFIASLEACQRAGRWCPPRLDDPPWAFDLEADADPKLETALRFDLDDWQKVTGELHGRACACRTLACVDSIEVAIARLEPRPMPDVRGDETASASVTRARECLFRLRGERAIKPPAE